MIADRRSKRRRDRRKNLDRPIAFSDRRFEVLERRLPNGDRRTGEDRRVMADRRMAATG